MARVICQKGLAVQFKSVHGQVFRKHHLFAQMNDQQLNTLMQTAQVVNLTRGEQLFMQGELAERFYLVTSGKLKLFRMLPDGTEKIIELMSENQTFAEALIFQDQGKYPVTAEAVEASTLFSFSNSDYKNLVKNDSNLAIELLGDLSLRLHRRIGEIEMLSLKNSTIRVVRYFLALLEQQGDGKLSLELPVAKRLIAAQLVIQPETLSRIFNRMKEDGIVEMDGRKINVLDLEKLKQYE
jgi:CRP-like cAMP-binding protein